MRARAHSHAHAFARGRVQHVLLHYLEACGGVDTRALRHVDFSTAAGSLVASIPGAHVGNAMLRVGHKRVGYLLRSRGGAVERAGARALCCQFSR